MAAYDALQRIRANPDDAAAQEAFAATKTDLGHGLLLTRYVDDPRLATEARHIDALLGVYARYGLRPPPDETLPDEAALTAPLTELCEVGVWAEIENVELYDTSLLPAVADYPDISAVFTRLRDASEHRHLPAFQRCVDRGGQGRRAGGRRRALNAFPGREDAGSSPGNA